jgi:hypothetical protein
MRRRASQRPHALPLIGDSCLRRPRLPRLMRTICLLRMAHGWCVCLFVPNECHRPRLRRDCRPAGRRPPTACRCAPVSGLTPRTSARGSAHAHLKPRCSAHAHRRAHTHPHAHTHTQARTNALAALQRRAPRLVHSAHAIRRTGPIRYTRRAEVLQVRYSK